MVQFKDIPGEILEKKVWTDMEVHSCANLIRENMDLLDDCLAILVRTIHIISFHLNPSFK
jgi:hypothetical protein